MKYKISETSRLWVSGDTATLLVHNSKEKRIVGWLCMFASIWLFIVFYFFEHALLYVGIGSVLFIYGLLSFGYKEFVVIDAKHRMIKRKSKILDFCFYSKLILWERKSELKYRI